MRRGEDKRSLTRNSLWVVKNVMCSTKQEGDTVFWRSGQSKGPEVRERKGRTPSLMGRGAEGCILYQSHKKPLKVLSKAVT